MGDFLLSVTYESISIRQVALFSRKYVALETTEPGKPWLPSASWRVKVTEELVRFVIW